MTVVCETASETVFAGGCVEMLSRSQTGPRLACRRPAPKLISVTVSAEIKAETGLTSRLFLGARPSVSSRTER